LCKLDASRQSLTGGKRKIASFYDRQKEEELSARELSLAAHAAWSKDDAQGCVSILRDALQKYPGDPAFLLFCCELATAGKPRFAAVIAKAYIAQHPNEARGYGTLAAVLNAEYAASEGTLSDLLPQIEENINIAESLGQLEPEAELAKCNIMRYKSMPRDQVTDAYEQLIDKYDSYAVAYYNYGLHFLVDDYERALAVFQKGALLAPGDPNFLLGQIRALIKLNREAEIWTLLTQAKQLKASSKQIEKIMRLVNQK
jgi:tetratricopeptide (TPR) repeat protein